MFLLVVGVVDHVLDFLPGGIRRAYLAFCLVALVTPGLAVANGVSVEISQRKPTFLELVQVFDLVS